MSLLIKNGLIVSSSGRYTGDVYVEGETIKAVGKGLDYKADKVIDATGKYILPGVIDPHTHLEMPFMGTTAKDDYKTGTVAAACGGVTTVVDFDIQREGESIHDCVERKKGWAKDKVAIDFSLHPGIVDPTPEVINEIKDAVHEYGTPSFKIFMVYDFRVDDE
ncbi:MAG: dihydropyrimidinase, partial [Spirochaetes bacterium]